MVDISKVEKALTTLPIGGKEYSIENICITKILLSPSLPYILQQ